MTYPMPPELLEQLGLEPCAETDPQWPEDRDALGWGRRLATPGEAAEDERQRSANEGCVVIADVGELYTSLAEYLLRIVGSRVSAPPVVIDDACQFAWYRLVVHARCVERDAALSWLVATAIREAIKLVRRDQRELSLEARIEDDGELNVASPLPGPHEQAERRERLELLRDLLVAIASAKQPEALLLAGREPAGREARLTKRTVERQIHHGRRTLKAAA
ncbi:MAG TPA: hypothetical protein VGH93_00090 [Solirubrobacteraceae bacterium]|jgi:DNA-directed RNA polymerase specialized sigma24 family protein